MLYEKISLDENDESVFLEVYAADENYGFERDGILVIPGGGYGCVCADREGEPIALAFLPYGYNAFVLHYPIGKKFPSQLICASKAMKYIKDNAEKYHVNSERIFTVGFSAGGHLAGSLGTLWHMDEIYQSVDMPYGYNKPYAIMLIYPVTNVNSHEDSFRNLLLEDFDEKAAMCEIDKCVDEKTVPAFIMHTANDAVVDVRGSLSLAKSLSDNNIPYEMHIYPFADHGAALANEITKGDNETWCNKRIAEWVRLAAEWAKEI